MNTYPVCLVCGDPECGGDLHLRRRQRRVRLEAWRRRTDKVTRGFTWAVVWLYGSFAAADFWLHRWAHGASNAIPVLFLYLILKRDHTA